MRNIILSVALVVGLSSCGSYRSLAYLQDVRTGETETIINSYAATVRTGDMLSIVVSSSKPELAMPYNIFAGSVAKSDMEGYTVGVSGTIDFPVLGTIAVAGLTREELAQKIKAVLVPTVPDAVVTVNFLNFRITVAGEVNRPGVYNITGDRVTILEALGMAGDLTTYGRRTNILVVREVDGVRSFAQLDLKSKEIFISDYYYLQQNDVVYVEPISARARTTSTFVSNFPMIVSLGSLATSITMIIYYLARIR